MSKEPQTFGLFDMGDPGFDCNRAKDRYADDLRKLFQLEENELKELFPNMSGLSKEQILVRLSVLFYDRTQNLSLSATVSTLYKNLCQ